MYLRLLHRLNWQAFTSIDQTGTFEHQLINLPANGLAIVKLKKVMGHGVVSRYQIGSGQAISEYLGTVSCNHKTSPFKNSAYAMAYPLPSLAGWVWTINALEKGNVARFVNHSRQPNVAIKIFFDGCLLRLALVSLRVIENGEALTLNYGPAYWSQRQQSV